MSLSRLALLFLALTLGGGSAVAAPPGVLGDTSSDIPGIPMPGSVVTGQLGGPIYDVVYRLDVPAGHVIVVGMTGTAGTDFDLYLFDASATTVLSDTGLLVKSTGPTSAEQLSWATRTGGTFYLDLNGATNVEGTYTLSVQTVPDPSPPVARLAVAGGATRVNTTQLTLQLAAFDDLSGVTEMSLSGDGVNWQEPQPFEPQFAWTIAPGDGTKTVWARAINGVGLISAPTSVSVVLDTVGPTVAARSPAPDAITTEPRPTFSVTFDEPIDADSWLSSGMVVQAPAGAIVPGSRLYYPSTRTGTFVPAEDLAPGMAYIVSLGEVRDLAGNVVQPMASWVVKRLLATRATLSASPLVAPYLRPVALSGAAVVPAGESVVLETKSARSSEFISADTITPSAGRYSVTLVPARNTTYRVVYPGSSIASPAASADIRVLVRRLVSLSGQSAAVTRLAARGRSMSLVAHVVPSGVAKVSFRLYRYEPTRGTYVYAGSFGRSTDETGVARLSWTPGPGRFYWRVDVLSTVDYANNTSPAYRFAVR